MKAQRLLFALALMLVFSPALAQYPYQPSYPSSHNDDRYEERNRRNDDRYEDDDRYEEDRRSPSRRNYPRPKVQIALILDVSGSMEGLIEQAKSQLWYIVNGVASQYEGGGQPELEISVFEYGNASLGWSNRYMRQLTPLTSDFDWVSAELFNLRIGGSNEFAGEAVNFSLESLDWSYRPGDLRLIYIAGNEDFDQGELPYQQVMRRAAEQGVIVSTIYCGNYQSGIYDEWQEAARLGGGEYLNIDHNYRQNRQRNPYDNDFYSCNERLNNTYVPYGSQGVVMQQRQRQQDQNALTYGSDNLTQRALVKASDTYYNPSWDLVDAVDAGVVRIESLPEDQLPVAMRGMSVSQKQAYIMQKKNERTSIRSEMRQLPVAKPAVASTQPSQSPAAGQSRPSGPQTLDQAVIKSTRVLQEKQTVTQVQGGTSQIQKPVYKPITEQAPSKGGAPQTAPERQPAQVQKPVTQQTPRQPEFEKSQPQVIRPQTAPAAPTTPATAPKSIIPGKGQPAPLPARPLPPQRP